MIYRVTATLFFIIADEATDFYHDCEIALPKSITVNPGSLNEEKGFITLEKCYHDETPAKSCEVISHDETA